MVRRESKASSASLETPRGKTLNELPWPSPQAVFVRVGVLLNPPSFSLYAAAPSPATALTFFSTICVFQFPLTRFFLRRSSVGI